MCHNEGQKINHCGCTSTEIDEYTSLIQRLKFTEKVAVGRQKRTAERSYICTREQPDMSVFHNFTPLRQK